MQQKVIQALLNTQNKIDNSGQKKELAKISKEK